MTSDCGNNTHLEHATIQFENGTFYQSSAYVDCDTGFRIKGSVNNGKVGEIITCSKDGTWTPATACVKKGNFWTLNALILIHFIGNASCGLTIYLKAY